MQKSIKLSITSKWITILYEYEAVKENKSKYFRTVSEICEAYKVNRRDIRRYYERWIHSGKHRDSLLPQKRGPKPGTMKLLTKEEERTIIKLNRKLQINEFEIYYLIEENRQFKVHPSVSTIYRTLKRYPLNKTRIKKIKRYEKKYPGEQLHADNHYISKVVFKDRKQRYLFGVLDDCTRLCYVELIPNLKASTVAKAFANGYVWFFKHGIKAREILTDNGSEFTKYTSKKDRSSHFFETILSIFNIKHRYIRPYRPQTNGKIERFWRTINNECINLQLDLMSEKEFLEELEAFMWRYNYQRRHSSLNYMTPLDKLKSVTETLK